MTERRLVRWMLFSAPFVCAFQWWVVRTHGETYPALMMPSFGSDANENFAVDTPTLVVFKGDSTVEHTAFRLFEGMEMSANYCLVRNRLNYRETL